MRILLTGGAGYVGSACLRHLVAHGHDAFAYDNLSQGHREAVPDGRLIEGDILDTEALTAAMRDVRADGVMHFAAATCVGESVEHPDRYYRTNVVGSLSVLEAMRSAAVRRILFSSTCATYGFSQSPMTEDTTQDPCSPYARTKLVVEWMIQDHARAADVSFALLRYFNAAGAPEDAEHGEDHTPENHLIPVALQVALGQRDKLLIFGDDYPTPDGTCVRDYVHVDDLAEAHRLALAATTFARAKVYNVGTGRGHSVREVVAACREVTGTPLPCETTGRRDGDAARLVADPARIKNELGWQPRHTDIRSIIESAWRWHEQHPDGYATGHTARGAEQAVRADAPR